MPQPNQKKIGVGILGAGGAGRTIMGKDIAEHSKLYDLAGFHDPFPKSVELAAAQYPGSKFYENYEALLTDPTVELVLVATPHHAHYSNAMQALKAGKHCVVIKPFCYTVAEADAMIQAAKDADRFVSCFQNVRWAMDFLLAMETLQSRDFGRLLYIASHPGGGYGADDCIYTWGSHWIDQLFLLAGSYPVEVSATFWNPEETDPDKQGSYVIQMRMSNGIMTSLNMLPPALNASSRRDLGARYQIVGTKEHYIGWRVDQLVDLMREHAYVGGDKGQIPYYTFNRPNFLEYRWKIPTYWERLAASIREGAPLLIPPEHTRQVAKVYEAATKSSQTGRMVALEDDGPRPFPSFDVLGEKQDTWVNTYPF